MRAHVPGVVDGHREPAGNGQPLRDLRDDGVGHALGIKGNIDGANHLGENVRTGQPGSQPGLQRTQTAGQVRAGGRRRRTPTAGRHTFTLRAAEERLRNAGSL